ncbi:MAG: hypothetical protein NTW26_07900, partial [bacterium]|nr:hypothetical protein [bacterium]
MKRLNLLAAIALLSVTTLIYELSLMRVFSVTVWYYFAFFVISLALLGYGAASALIFVFGNWFRRHAGSIIPLAAVLYGLFAAVSPLVYLNVDLRIYYSFGSYLKLAIILALFFIPFFFSGVVLAGIFSLYSERIGTIYWADLSGASLGCLVVIPLLYLIPATSLLVWVGALPVIAALLLHRFLGGELGTGTDRGGGRKFFIPALAAGALVLLLAVSSHTPLNPYEIRYSKVAHKVEKPIYTTWNSFARLTVYDNIFWREPDKPFGWGMSPAFSGSGI